MRGTRLPTIAVLLVHDPDGRYIGPFEERQTGFSAYEAVFAAVTQTTHPALVGALDRSGAIICITRPAEVGVSQRSVLDLVGRHVGSAGVLSCDFDRWLHWRGTFPDELESVPVQIATMRPAPWYVCVGRTARAFATHPLVQRRAESATNRALRSASGKRLDATAGACWLSPKGLDLVLAESVERTKATDLEWPGIILRADRRRLGGIRTEGLEFETSEFYGEEVRAVGGIASWLTTTYDQPAMWRDRLRLAADSVGALTRVLDDALAWSDEATHPPFQEQRIHDGPAI